MKQRVLLIGLDGATPSIASPLLDRGELPHLQRFAENGSFGTLVASPPLVRSMVWTSLATGKRAPRHGVCGNMMVRADGAGVEPTGHAAWRAHAVWELLTAAGFACATIGWPASAPAASWETALCIDDAFADPVGPGFDAWALMPECVAPMSLRDIFRDLRVHPGDITPRQIAALVPKGNLVDQDEDPRLTRLAYALARASTVHAAATHAAAQDSWDFLAVAYPLLAEVQRELLRFRAPRLADVQEIDFEIYRPVVDIVYRVQDAMLGTLLSAVDEQTFVLVVSPYGFAAAADRPTDSVARRWPASIAWHRTPGFLAAAGEHVVRDALVHGACVEDIAPTILRRFGLRCEEHDGRPISELCGAEQMLRNVSLPSIDDAASPAQLPEDVHELEPRQRERVKGASIAWIANTAESFLSLGDYASAAERYAQLVALLPGDWIAKARLARCQLHLGNLGECRRLAAEVIEAQPDVPWGHLLGAAGLILDGQADKADAYLRRARESGRELPNVTLRLGMLHLLCQDWTHAEALFREAVKMTPRSAEAYDGLGCALFAQNRYDEALATFRTALGHAYHHPLAHLHHAMALAARGRWDEAEEAARTALAQDAQVPGADALIGRISHARIESKAPR